MNKKIVLFFLVILIFLGVYARFISLDKDFTADEPDFVKAALELEKTGRISFYHSEQQPNEIALWHPPFYLFTLATVFNFSHSEIFARLPNFILFLFSLLNKYIKF